MNTHTATPAGSKPAPAIGSTDGGGLIRITGGRTLRAETQVNGAREAALPLLAAAAATRRRVTLARVPGSRETATMLGLIEACGWSITRAGTRVEVSAEKLGSDYPEADVSAAGNLPGSHLGPMLLGAFGRAELPYPGGSTLIEQSMDLTFKVYEAFADSVHEYEGGYLLTAAKRAPRNVEISLPYPDRSATITALLRAASLEASTVTIHNPTSPRSQPRYGQRWRRAGCAVPAAPRPAA